MFSHHKKQPERPGGKFSSCNANRTNSRPDHPLPIGIFHRPDRKRCIDLPPARAAQAGQARRRYRRRGRPGTGNPPVRRDGQHRVDRSAHATPWSGWTRARRACTSRSSWPTPTRPCSSSPAPSPAPHMRMLDRFLVIAGRQGLPALIVANKIDLVGRTQAEEMFGFYPHDRLSGYLCLRQDRRGCG